MYEEPSPGSRFPVLEALPSRPPSPNRAAIDFSLPLDLFESPLRHLCDENTSFLPALSRRAHIIFLPPLFPLGQSTTIVSIPESLFTTRARACTENKYAVLDFALIFPFLFV